jgi:hypothetical protein
MTEKEQHRRRRRVEGGVSQQQPPLRACFLSRREAGMQCSGKGDRPTTHPTNQSARPPARPSVSRQQDTEEVDLLQKLCSIATSIIKHAARMQHDACARTSVTFGFRCVRACVRAWLLDACVPPNEYEQKQTKETPAEFYLFFLAAAQSMQEACKQCMPSIPSSSPAMSDDWAMDVDCCCLLSW